MDTKNGYMHIEKAEHGDFLAMIFLKIVFQTSYEESFIVKREYVW